MTGCWKIRSENILPPRSGSSFLGNMLTLAPMSTYIFEPLRQIRWGILAKIIQF